MFFLINSLLIDVYGILVETNANWLTPEMLSLFMFHEVRNLSQPEEVHIIKELVR